MSLFNPSSSVFYFLPHPKQGGIIVLFLPQLLIVLFFPQLFNFIMYFHNGQFSWELHAKDSN